MLRDTQATNKAIDKFFKEYGEIKDRVMEKKKMSLKGSRV